MLQLVGFIFKYLPLIVSAVALVEKLTDQAASGADKKVVVVRVVKESLTKFGVTVTPQIEALIGQTIDVAVTVLNLFGIFKHEDATEDSMEAAEEVSAEQVAHTARVIEESPTEARLKELEAKLRQ